MKNHYKILIMPDFALSFLKKSLNKNKTLGKLW